MNLLVLHLFAIDHQDSTLCGLAYNPTSTFAVRTDHIKEWPSDKARWWGYRHCKKCWGNPRIPLLQLAEINL